MSGVGRGKQLTRPAWMHNPRAPMAHGSTPNPNSPNPRINDWVQTRAPNGSMYWYSPSTRQTWYPSSHASQPSTGSQQRTAHESQHRQSQEQTPGRWSQQASKDVSSGESNQWKQHTTKDGRTYYYNTITKATQWNPPAGFPASTASAGDSIRTPSKGSSSELKATLDNNPSSKSSEPDDLPTGWASHKTPDGRVYYYHAVTRETRWSKPSVADLPTKEKQELHGIPPAAASAPISSTSLPSAWAESTTADGKVYYYNKLTRQTSWTKPVMPIQKRPRSPQPRETKGKAASPHASGQKERFTRRPRTSDGKPMNDRSAEEYFLKRAISKMHLKDSGKEEEDEITPEVDPFKREKQFMDMLKEKEISVDKPWLDVMAMCVSDSRYLFLESYGRRRHAWLKYCQKEQKSARRQKILDARNRSKKFIEAMEEIFANEPEVVRSIDQCHPKAIREFENDPRHKALPERERMELIRAFFMQKKQRDAFERAARRTRALNLMRGMLHDKIDPDFLRRPDEPIPEAPEASEEVDKSYFTLDTPIGVLQQFLNNLDCSKDVSRDDMDSIVRSWRREMDSISYRNMMIRRDMRRAVQKENRAAFRNGIKNMLLKGTLPLDPSWKDVSALVGEQDFAMEKEDLGARPVELFDDGVKMFGDHVHSYSDPFKRLLKQSKTELSESTTLAELKATEPFAAFFKELEDPVAEALLRARKVKEGKRREKEKTKARAEFENMIRSRSPPVEEAFEAALKSLADLPAYERVTAVLSTDELKQVYENFMKWRKAGADHSLKRSFDNLNSSGMYNHGNLEAEASKRQRLSALRSETIPYSSIPEEDTGWAAAVSAKPITEAEKLAERQRKKEELLKSLGNTNST